MVQDQEDFDQRKFRSWCVRRRVRAARYILTFQSAEMDHGMRISTCYSSGGECVEERES